MIVGPVDEIVAQSEVLHFEEWVMGCVRRQQLILQVSQYF